MQAVSVLPLSIMLSRILTTVHGQFVSKQTPTLITSLLAGNTFVANLVDMVGMGAKGVHQGTFFFKELMLRCLILAFQLWVAKEAKELSMEKP